MRIDLIDEWIPYAAGLFEADGTIYANPRQALIILAIRMTDAEPLYKVDEILGELGTYHSKILPSGKTYYELIYSSFEKVQFVAAILWPHLAAPRRKEQVRNALTTYNKNWKGRPTYHGRHSR